ncbi:MAG TPA: O-antigen ligase family protein [Solirubrobacterales bacterium]|nr:O-antigen ligase family protein [Solirubrobacterales bacterium]
MAGAPITTATSSLSRAERLWGAVRLAALAVAVLLFEVVLAAGIVNERLSRLLVLFAAVAGVAVLFRFPLISAMVMLACTDFILAPDFFSLPAGPIEVRPYELILGGLLLVALVRPQKRTWGGATGIFLAIFLILVAASGIQATMSGRTEAGEVLAWGRSIGMLLFFYVVVRLLPGREDRRALLLAAAVLAALTGVVALLVSLGWSLGETLQGEGDQIIREEEGVGGVNRVRLAGLSLGYAMFWYVATQVVFSEGKRRLGWGLLFAGIAVNIIVSFNRNMWLGLIAGLLLMLVVGGPQIRGRFVIAIVMVATGLAVITVVGRSGEDRLLEPVVERASTIFAPGDIAQENSLQDRENENALAWEVAKDNLALGVGVGAPLGVYTYEQSGSYTYVRTPQLFLHNQYLYLLLAGGVGALAAFLAFLLWPLAAAYRRASTDPAIAACGVGIAMIMMSSVVAIYFTSESMTAVLALLAGVIVADAQETADDPTPA